jgi:hypothetical protein
VFSGLCGAGSVSVVFSSVVIGVLLSEDDSEAEVPQPEAVSESTINVMIAAILFSFIKNGLLGYFSV